MTSLRFNDRLSLLRTHSVSVLGQDTRRYICCSGSVHPFKISKRSWFSRSFSFLTDQYECLFSDAALKTRSQFALCFLFSSRHCAELCRQSFKEDDDATAEEIEQVRSLLLTQHGVVIFTGCCVVACGSG